MIKLSHIILLLIILAACSASKNKKLPDNLNSFVGTWQLENSNTFEIWENHGTFYSGQVLKIENADTLIVEELRIFTDRNAVYYEATVPSQNNGKPVRFKLIRQTNNEFQFENPNHDFPQKIIYTFLNKKELKAIISGGNKQASFNYYKTK